jgi:hypothetical protein
MAEDLEAITIQGRLKVKSQDYTIAAVVMARSKHQEAAELLGRESERAGGA